MVFLRRPRGLRGSAPLAFRDLPLQGCALRVRQCLLRLRRLRALGFRLGLALGLLCARQRPCLRGLLALRRLRPLSRSGVAGGVLTSPSVCCSSLSKTSSSGSLAPLAQPAGTGLEPCPSSMTSPSLLTSPTLATGASSLGEHPCACLDHGWYLLREQRRDVPPLIVPPLATWRGCLADVRR